MFDERKVAQIAAFFINEEDGSISVLKLVKLIYLADRQAIDTFNFPISEDEFVSMPHGPVVSNTYNLICGIKKAKAWDDLISAVVDHKVSLKRKIEQDDLNELSNAEIKVMKDVWHKFGDMDRWKISDYTHEHCSEWRDPHGSSRPLAYEEVFIALGRSKDEAWQSASDIRHQYEIDRLFASL